MLLTFYHVYTQYMAAKGKKTSSASSQTKAKARSWLSSLKGTGEERATEAVAPPAEARTVATPENKPPPMSRAKSVRKAAAKLTGMSGAFSGKKKAETVEAAPAPAPTTEKVVAKVEETTDKAEAAAATKVDDCAEINLASMAWGGRGDSYLVPRRSTRPPPPRRRRQPSRWTPRWASSASTRRTSPVAP